MAGDVEAVLGEFFVLTDEGWTHTRCDEEIEKMQDKQAKARKSAQASVNARRANVERSLQEQSTGVERSLDKSVTDVELPTPTPTPTPVLKNTPLPPNGGDVLFAKFWSAYPRKVGKDVARKAFDKRKPSTELVDLMVQAVNRQKMTPQWAKEGGQFIPHPSTWINEGRWMDGEQPGQSDSTWFREAGFEFDWVANNAGCYPNNFKKFANGKRLEAA